MIITKDKRVSTANVLPIGEWNDPVSVLYHFQNRPHSLKPNKVYVY